MLELRNVSYTVTDNGKKDILKNINLVIDDRFVVITGPNGSGKSTLAKIIAGIITPTSGQILLDGVDITEMGITERAKAGISFAFQAPVRFKGITVKDGSDVTIVASGLMVQESIKACEILAKEGFVVMPYMYPDLNAARDLVNAGAASVMPLASPIGSNKGLATKEFIQILIDEIDLPIIVDAGIGRPSQACEAMEMGAAAIMANTALATAGDLPMMASAFKNAIEAGRKAYLSGLGRVLTRGASASDPLTGFLRD